MELDHVRQAVTVLESEGKSVTNKNILKQLGKGSMRDVQRHVRIIRRERDVEQTSRSPLTKQDQQKEILMAEVQERKEVKASTNLQVKPSQEALPLIGWLPVADLQVDYSYQHRPYAKMIEDLNHNFQEEYSGFILVNQRQDGTYWVLDGQTRCAVHEERQLRWIKAEILHGLTQAQEAEVYLLKCINAKRMPIDFFLAEYMAQRPVAVLIHDLLATRGIEIESYASNMRERGADTTPIVTCVSTLKRMIGRDQKGEVFAMVFDLIRDTWEYRGTTLTGFFLDAIHKMLLLHADELDRRAFLSKLSGHQPEELRDQANIMRLGTNPKITMTTALQRVIIDLYNSGRPASRRITLGSPSSSPTL